jgi:alanyl-tRNA synthetase
MQITTNDVRDEFINFFIKHGHHVANSSPLIPKNDPTLMFTNAGMVQFKDIFTGNEKLDFSRAVSSQKCVRAGGKHNDLDNVGYTLRHHTFFEMLGNFSFGDYFKEEAIKLAWDLITKEFKINQNKLVVTVHSSDSDASKIWKKITSFPDHKIIHIPTNDNFWSMGDSGPCGPCSEIFYDHGDNIPGGPPGSVNQDGDRFVEIWNLVFMQYEQLSTTKRINLPKPSVDTGMGLERLTALLNNTNDNFSIDIFKTLINKTTEIINSSLTTQSKNSLRVIADHIRAITFLIGDGVLPSNEGRGYVLRRIMRRAMRHAHLMNYKKPILFQLVNSVTGLYSSHYPELLHSEKLITDTIHSEEIRFNEMLERGIKLLNEEVVGLNDGEMLSGEIAFKLYDTYGFPLDLTEDALRPRGIKVDLEAFNLSMKKQKIEARKSWSGSGEDKVDKLWFNIKDNIKPTEFLGYSHLVGRGNVVSLVSDDTIVNYVSEGGQCYVISNQTPFYAEAGGQVGDIGYINGLNGSKLEVTDTQKKLDSFYVHKCRVIKGKITNGDEIKFQVDERNRSAVAKHHSATHLLHASLRKNLGTHIFQKGSLVSADRLRFDFSHPRPLTKDDFIKIEKNINNEIRSNSRVITRIMSPEDAISDGATALFGEKYSDEVRVVSMGHENKTKSINFSIELCGGTHVSNTGEIGLFKIINEMAVSSGVRRIEAVVGNASETWYSDQIAILEESANILKVSTKEIPYRIASLQAEKKKLEKEVTYLRKKVMSSDTKNNTDKKIDSINGINFVGRVLDNVPPRDLKGFADDIGTSINSGVVVLISVTDVKVSIVISVSKDLIDSIDAVSLVKIASSVVGGKGGGGRVDMAQAGGPIVSKANDIVPAIKDEISKLKI